MSKPDDTIKGTGEIVLALADRVEYLKSSILALNDSGLLNQLFYMATRIDPDIASGTFQQFKPGLPLTVDSAIYALIFGLLASLIFFAFRVAIKIGFAGFFGSRAES